jgi:hypothetical protein
MYLVHGLYSIHQCKTYGVKCLPCLEEGVCEPPVCGPADQQERQQRRVQEVETQQDGAVPDKQVAGATDISCKWRQIIGLPLVVFV